MGNIVFKTRSGLIQIFRAIQLALLFYTYAIRQSSLLHVLPLQKKIKTTLKWCRASDWLAKFKAHVMYIHTNVRIAKKGVTQTRISLLCLSLGCRLFLMDLISKTNPVRGGVFAPKLKSNYFGASRAFSSDFFFCSIPSERAWTPFAMMQRHSNGFFFLLRVAPSYLPLDRICSGARGRPFL